MDEKNTIPRWEQKLDSFTKALKRLAHVVNESKHRQLNDIDIVLQGDNLSYRHIADIENKLDNLYLPYTIDLSDMKSLTSPALIMNIKRDGKAI